ncbi:MAG: T9SS type A sorting domain-containing protein, partial [bacterium]
PFNATARVELNIPEPGTASWNLYDLSGRIVSYGSQIFSSPGKGEFFITGTDKASGIYYLVLHWKKFSTATKLILLR